MYFQSIKKEVKLSLSVPCGHIGCVKAQLHSFLTSVLDTGVRPTSHTVCFIPRERVSDTHWIGDWWPSELFCTYLKGENLLSLQGIKPHIILSTALSLHWVCYPGLLNNNKVPYAQLQRNILKNTCTRVVEKYNLSVHQTQWTTSP